MRLPYELYSEYLERSEKAQNDASARGRKTAATPAEELETAILIAGIPAGLLLVAVIARWVA